MQNEVYFIRHGESDCGELNHNDFVPDLEGSLSNTGIEQAKLLGLILANQAIVFDIIYSSPKERAIQSADIVQTTYKSVAGRILSKGGVIISDSIKSRSFGLWDRKNKTEVLNDSNKYDYYHNPNFRTPEGESSWDVYERTVDFLENLLRSRIGIIGVFSHSKVLECIHRYISHKQNPEIPPFGFSKFEPRNTEVIKVYQDSSGLSNMSIGF